MKLSIQHTRLPGTTLDEQFGRAAEYGFSGVELATGAFPRPLDNYRSEVEQAIRSSGVSVSSLCTSSSDDLVHPDPSERARRLDGLVRHLELSESLGATGVIALPIRRAIRMSGTSSESEESALVTQLLLAQLRAALDRTPSVSAAILLEPLNRYEATYLRTVGHASDLCRELGHPRAQVMADFFHMNIEEADVAASLAGASDSLGHVHLADSNRSLPGYGHTDFGTAFRTLRDLGYEGWFAPECSVPGDPAETARSLQAAPGDLGAGWRILGLSPGRRASPNDTSPPRRLTVPRRLAATSPYEVEILDYDDPPLGVGQVLVSTELASGKHGTTMAMFDGGVYRGQHFDQEMRLFIEAEPTTQAPLPGRVGTSGVGTVVEVGQEVTRWKVGDRVFGLMDVRETNICREGRLYELGNIDPHLALCIEPSYVAFHCIRESQVRYGDQVAIFGLGALGLLAVRMALLAGAETVFALDLLPARRAWAAANGADHVLDPTEGDVALEIHHLTGGKGVDVAIELAGAYPALGLAIRSARVGGTVCSAGFYQREAHAIWLGREWHHNRLTMIVPHGCGWGHPPRDFPRWDEARAYECIANMMRKGRLTAPGLIGPVVSLDDGPEVWRMIRDEPDQVIKYAIRF